MSNTVSFSERLRLAQKQLRKDTPAAPPADPADQQWDPSLIPDIEAPQRSEEDIDIDRILDNLGILEAYSRWCGKSQPEPKGKTEGIHVSCPKPDHLDRNPSAWVNTENNTWYCGTCQVGGDAYDIAAYRFGFPVPGYKDGKNFHDLRRAMAESMGYVFKQIPGGETVVIPPEPEPTPSPAVTAQTAQPPVLASVTPLPVQQEEEDADDFGINYPTLDWRSIVPAETFLDVWMQQTSIDDVPEEYHFWNGLLAIGMALGRDVTLFDSRPVFANLFICTLGPSGAGKSKAKSHLDRLIDAALPYDKGDPNSKGTKRINTAQSAEALVWAFRAPIEDPNKPGKILHYAPVRALIDYNELSSLVARTQRAGNALNPALMQVYDCESKIGVLSRTYGEETAENPFGSAITTTQPRSIRNLVSDADVASGFLNRWLFVTGAEKELVAIGGAQVDVMPAVMPLKQIFGWSGITRMVDWSDEAAGLFTEFFHSTIYPAKRADENGLLTRSDLLMKKLVLLFTANMRAQMVPIQAVQQAIACWDYIVACYAIPAAHVGSSLQNEIREEILRHCRKMSTGEGKGITMKELMDRLKRKNWPRDLVYKVIDYMVKLEEIESIKQSGPGRPTVRYKWTG